MKKFIYCLLCMAVTANAKTTSHSAYVVDYETMAPIYSKNINVPRPIASITKLMTAMVVLDANPSLEEMILLTTDDIDTLKKTTSRLPIGNSLSRYEMLHLALMSSENRAASALSRNYPGGKTAFVVAMNQKAKELGMTSTTFVDPTGLSPKNISTAADLIKMIDAAVKYPTILWFTSMADYQINVTQKQTNLYLNSNYLARDDSWDIGLSKTGHINEAGYCLVMMTNIRWKLYYMVFLHSTNKGGPMKDASAIRNHISGYDR